LNNFNFFHPKDDPSLLDILVNNHAVTCSVSAVYVCVQYMIQTFQSDYKIDKH